MKRYDNGELITKSRMDEETIHFFKDLFEEELSDENKMRILRWCVLHVERMGGQQEIN
jgi:hypothetical protein